MTSPSTLLPVVRAEWIKLRTSRGTVVTGLVAAVVSVALGALHCHSILGSASQLDQVDPVAASLFGLSVGQFVICVCGALTMTTEYGVRTIHTTLTAVPGRARLLVAKALVVTATAFVWGLVVAASSLAIGYAILSSTSAVDRFGFADAARAVVACGGFFAGLAAIGFSLAVVVRRTAAAIVAIAVVLLLAPTILDPLPAGPQTTLKKYVPLKLADDLITRHPGPDSLHPTIAAVALATEVAVVFLLGVAMFIRRDA